MNELLAPPPPPAHVKISTFNSMVGGALAGLVVDVGLFPIDSIKTRLQYYLGFQAAGGFKRIYSGIGPVVLGSGPSSAMFFITYTHSVSALRPHCSSDTQCSCISAAIAELSACLIRVPSEIVKQRMQIDPDRSFRTVLRETVARNRFLNLYTGFGITILREIPFSFIQFPIWEGVKKWFEARSGQKCTNAESAIGGFVSGGISGLLTTPLDVIKTRKMTSHPELKVSQIFTMVRKEKALFKGAAARTCWLSIGGALYLGSYDLFIRMLE